MTRHWAEEYYSNGEITPVEGDEELFLSVQLIGEKELAARYRDKIVNPYYSGGPHFPDVLEQFARDHHKKGRAAATGIWVRYDIWRDRQTQAHVAAQKAVDDRG